MDLRGHGLSDAPTATGAYDAGRAGRRRRRGRRGIGRARGRLGRARRSRLRRDVAAAAAAQLGDRCARLVLVDGGLADVAEATGQDVDEFLRALEEPPEVMRSMTAYLRGPPVVGPGDLGRRPGAGGAGRGRRDAGRSPRVGDAAARARGLRPDGVRLPAGGRPAAGHGGRRRRQANHARRRGRNRRRRRPFRPAPTSSTSRRPVTTCCATDRTRSRRRSSAARLRAMRVVYSPAHLAHDTVTETVLGSVIPANEVAERAERIRATLEADGGFTIEGPIEHGTAPDPRGPRSRASSGSSRRPGRRRGPSRSAGRTSSPTRSRTSTCSRA